MDKSTNQNALYKFITDYKITHDGNTPTYREIIASGGLGFASSSKVKEGLDVLVEQGLITVKRGKISVVGGQWVPPTPTKEEILDSAEITIEYLDRSAADAMNDIYSIRATMGDHFIILSVSGGEGDPVNKATEAELKGVAARRFKEDGIVKHKITQSGPIALPLKAVEDEQSLAEAIRLSGYAVTPHTRIFVAKPKIRDLVIKNKSVHEVIKINIAPSGYGIGFDSRLDFLVFSGTGGFGKDTVEITGEQRTNKKLWELIQKHRRTKTLL